MLSIKDLGGKCLVPLSLLVVPTLVASQVAAWEFVGIDGERIGYPVEIFVEPSLIEKRSDGLVSTFVLGVLPPHGSAGVDVYHPDGRHELDTRYPHRSYVVHELYDCNRKLSALVSTHYFSGTRPVESQLVFESYENEVFLFDAELPGLPSAAFRHVCGLGKN